ncbi:lambda-crystallin [Patella vulgata]|uniref:lambda-crystallin n=1 Tax=Patella vulgata TaxID=6465 RepID=UPI00217FA501|nr:lambda-crystallin [Patella vulgata]
MAAKDTPTSDMIVGIIGSGLIGQSWAMLFASAGYQVKIYDVDVEQVKKALQNIEQQLLDLQEQGLLRGNLNKQEQRERITAVSTIGDCVKGAFYIQECVPERLDIKKGVWGEVDKIVNVDVIMASSSSSLLPSKISDGLKHRNRFLVSHPTNPPFYAPLVEIIPAPWTDDDVVPTTKSLLERIGQVPVVLKKEIDGFVLNRIQYSIIGEAWRLINDDIISAEDLDKVMSTGLGVRYAFMGPLETAYLNADGMKSYIERYAEMVYRIQKSFGQPLPMGGETGDKIHKELESYVCPVECLAERRQWRDKRLAALAKLKKEMDKGDSAS